MVGPPIAYMKIETFGGLVAPGPIKAMDSQEWDSMYLDVPIAGVLKVDDGRFVLRVVSYKVIGNFREGGLRLAFSPVEAHPRIPLKVPLVVFADVSLRVIDHSD